MSLSRKILVLGANSFSGQDFVDLLLDDPQNQVLGISRSAERSSLFLRYRNRTDLGSYRYYQIDMNRQMPQLLELLDAEQPQFIVNFAAQSEVAPQLGAPGALVSKPTQWHWPSWSTICTNRATFDDICTFLPRRCMGRARERSSNRRR